MQKNIVLEVYDGDARIQIEFEDIPHFYRVIQRDPAAMMEYFRDHLFDSPEMEDPREALTRMAATSGEEGLVTVPPEDDDEALFDAMTTIFQKTAELSGNASASAGDGGDFLQSLVRDQDPDAN